MSSDIAQQIEPVRISILDLLLENLKFANRETFVHRLIYIGEHHFGDASYGTTIAKCIERSVKVVNEAYNDEHLSGLLLCYPKYFCHVIEGSEDAIIKHLKVLTETEQCKSKLGILKNLICYHHINQRFLPGWMAITGEPEPLRERINPSCDLDETLHYVYKCIYKLYQLAYYQRIKLAGAGQLRLPDFIKSEKKPETPKTEDLPATEKSSKLSEKSKSSKKDTSKTTVASESVKPPEGKPTTSSLAGSSVPSSRPSKRLKKDGIVKFKIERYQDCLPPYGLIQFLLRSPYIQNLYDYINIYGAVLEQDEYKDMVWPVPSEFVPYNIFDVPIDPIPDLPSTTQQDTTPDNSQNIEET